MGKWTNNFTTLFNKSYLAKGMALCQSLENVCNDFRLFLFAFDDETEVVVKKMAFAHVIIVSLKQLEDYCPELIKEKEKKTIAEYCWTCKGPSMQYCLDKFGLESICYMDSDLFFYHDPALLFQESPSSDVILTKHDFFNVPNLGESNGFHCAQYMAFKNNDNGRNVLNWWTNLCMDWCYARHEKGRFGDQKYLDLFSDNWSNVYDIVRNGCCGPWNIQRYNVVSSREGVMVDTGNKKAPLVFYHFHFLRNKRYDLFEEFNFGPYGYSQSVRRLIYKPYIDKLKVFEQRSREIYPEIDALGSEPRKASVVRQIYHLLRFILKENTLIWKRK